MSLIQALPPGPLDIVGDIHGEFDALEQLLAHLGYSANGEHAQGRTLVFVGDFCDRGPDSPAVLARIAQLVQAGRAVAVLGNHEINLLREDVKDGSGWYFDARIASDEPKYAPFARPSAAERAAIVEFLVPLPVALERHDLRIVHAAWLDAPIAAARTLALGDTRAAYDRWEEEVRQQARAGTLAQRMKTERQSWPHSLENGEHPPPFLPAHGENELLKAMLNPLKVLTSGVERLGDVPFFCRWQMALCRARSVVGRLQRPHSGGVWPLLAPSICARPQHHHRRRGRPVWRHRAVCVARPAAQCVLRRLLGRRALERP